MQNNSSGHLLNAYCQQVKRCTQIALNCLENDRHERPNVVDIIQKLKETEEVIEKLKAKSRHLRKVSKSLQAHILFVPLWSNLNYIDIFKLFC